MSPDLLTEVLCTQHGSNQDIDPEGGTAIAAALSSLRALQSINFRLRKRSAPLTESDIHP
jgi:hypothetical protein